MNLTTQSLKDEFLGRVCMTGDGECCLLNQRIARLTPTGVHPRFAFWLFKSPRFRRYVDELNTGSLIQHLFTSQVDDFVLPVPTKDEQAEIVRCLENLLSGQSSLELIFSGLPDKLTELGSAILAKAFRGELVPQEADDQPASAIFARPDEERPASTHGRRLRRATHR